MSSKITRVTTAALLVALTAAVGVQSFSLHRLHAKLDARLAAAESDGRLADRSAEPPSRSVPAPPADTLDPFGRDPFREMERMRARIDEIFADSLGRFDLDAGSPDVVVPRVDVTEDGDEYLIRVDVPGADGTSLDVSVVDRSLRISGDTSQEIREEEPGSVLRRERRVGHFERRLALPGPVDSRTLKTDYADGVLNVRVHKA